MRSKTTLVVLAAAIWWVLVNLPWLKVGNEEFTGGQLLPVLNLLPAITITAIFIALYGRLRKTLLAIALVVLGGGLYLSLLTELSLSSAVISELERLSGVMNPDSHEAGVSITESWGKYAAIAANAVAISATLPALCSRSGKVEGEKTLADKEDNRSLWDEQN
jgi:hypothetical protein